MKEHHVHKGASVVSYIEVAGKTCSVGEDGKLCMWSGGGESKSEHTKSYIISCFKKKVLCCGIPVEVCQSACGKYVAMISSARADVVYVCDTSSTLLPVCMTAVNPGRVAGFRKCVLLCGGTHETVGGVHKEREERRRWRERSEGEEGEEREDGLVAGRRNAAAEREKKKAAATIVSGHTHTLCTISQTGEINYYLLRAEVQTRIRHARSSNDVFGRVDEISTKSSYRYRSLKKLLEEVRV